MKKKNNKVDVDAMKQAKTDMYKSGIKQSKEDEEFFDTIKSSKDKPHYEDEDGMFEITWKKLMRLIS